MSEHDERLKRAERSAYTLSVTASRLQTEVNTLCTLARRLAEELKWHEENNTWARTETRALLAEPAVQALLRGEK